MSVRASPGLLCLLVACAPSVPKARSHVVEIRGFAFQPATLEVAAGDTVVWVNRDVVPHTATRAAQAWDSGSLGAQETWRLVAREKGSQPYVCTFHPNMQGTLVVR